MPFDWLVPDVPASVRARGPERLKAQHTDEVRVRAALLRRLGYDEAFATWRCQRNLAWGYERAGEAPLTAAQVAEVVAEVYRR